MNRLQELRKARGLNQTQVAQEMSISQSTLSYWERGDYEPDNESLIALADFFGVTTDYLLGRDDQTKKDLPIEEAYLEKLSGGIKLSEIDIALFNTTRELDEEDIKEIQRDAERMLELKRLRELNDKNRGND